MTHGTSTRDPSWLPALVMALLAAALLACGVLVRSTPDQGPTAHWPARQLLFVAGPAGGEVRQFQLVGGRPVEAGVLRTPGRVRVLDLAVDEVRGGVWVLSPRALELHPVATGAQRRYLALPAELAAVALRVDAEGNVTLADAAGHTHAMLPGIAHVAALAELGTGGMGRGPAGWPPALKETPGRPKFP